MQCFDVGVYICLSQKMWISECVLQCILEDVGTQEDIGTQVQALSTAK